MSEESDGVINPWAIPVPGVAADELRSTARDLTTISQDIANIGNDVKADWKSLEGPYQAPEVDELLTKINPVASKGDTYRDSAKTAADALIAFADEAERLKGKLVDLRGQAFDFVNSIADDDDWRKDEKKVEAHEDIRTGVTDAVKQYNDAEIECANKITALFGGTTFVPTGEKGGQEYGIGNVSDDAAMPWGAPQEVDTWYDWAFDVGRASGDFFVSIGEDAAGAAGLYTEDGGWGASSLGEWGGNLKQYWGDAFYGTAALTGMYGEDGWLFQGGATPMEWWGNFSYAWGETIHSVFPWREGLVYAATTAGWNLAMIAAGAAISATGYGAVVGIPMIASRVMKVADAVSGVGRKIHAPDSPGDSTPSPDGNGKHPGAGQPQQQGGAAPQAPGTRPQGEGGPTSSSSDSGSESTPQPGVEDMKSSVNELENKIDDSQPTDTPSQSQDPHGGDYDSHSSGAASENNSEVSSGSPATGTEERSEPGSRESKGSSDEKSEWDLPVTDYDSVSVSDVEKLDQRLRENGGDMEEALEYVSEQKKKEQEEFAELELENSDIGNGNKELVEVAAGRQAAADEVGSTGGPGPVVSHHGPDDGSGDAGKGDPAKDSANGPGGTHISTGGQAPGDVHSGGPGNPSGGSGGPHVPGGGSGADPDGGYPEHDPMKSSEYWDQVLEDARPVSAEERPPGAGGKMDPQHEKEVWNQLRGLRIPPEDVAKMVEGLKKDPYGGQVAKYIVDGKYENVPGYKEMIADVKTGKSRPDKESMMAAVHMAMRHADSLLGRGVDIQDVMFEVKGKQGGAKYDYDVLVKGEGGSWENGYQMKDVTSASGVKSAAKSASKQLKLDKAENRYAVLDVHDSIENVDPADVSEIYRMHLRTGAAFHIRFEDKVVSVPEGSRLLP